MSSSRSTLFDFYSSSSSDDSDIDDLLDDDMEQFVLLLATKELQEPLRKKRQGSKVGRLCIPRNRVLGNELLMQECMITLHMYQHIPLTYFIDGIGCVGSCL
jgi:hypothetical protein